MSCNSFYIVIFYFFDSEKKIWILLLFYFLIPPLGLFKLYYYLLDYKFIPFKIDTTAQSFHKMAK